MKNAMKKLLSLVLVAMLLVSVVPLGAMAVTNTTVEVYIDNIKQTGISGNKTLDDSMTLSALVQSLVPGYADYTITTYKSGTGVTDPNTETVQGATSIQFYLTTQNAEVKVQFEGESTEYKAYYPVTGTVTLNTNLLSAAGAVVPSNKKVIGWNYNGTPKSTGDEIDVDHGMATIVCRLGDISTNENENGGSTTTSHKVTFFDVNGNNIWSIDVANGSNVDTADNTTTTQVTYAEQNVGTKAGYTFDGWQIEKTGTVYSTQSASQVTITGATNFYPKFTQNSAPSTTKYTVRFFDANNANHWTIEVDAGSTIDIADNNSTTKIGWAESNVGVKSGHTFSGWRKNGEGETLSTATVAQLAINSNTSFYPVFTKDSSSSSNSGSTKFVNDIYLNIYLNGKVDSPAKSVKLNGYTIISDDVINLTEVLTVVDDYYTAVDANKGLILDGLYLTKGNFVSNYATDSGKSSSIGDLTAKRYESTVGINVMVTNAKAKTSSTADSSNPKTGDAIFAPVAVLTLSTAALAAVYFISKKRVVR